MMTANRRFKCQNVIFLILNNGSAINIIGVSLKSFVLLLFYDLIVVPA